MSILEVIEFGKFIKGVKGTATRIEWKTDIKAKINCLNQNGPTVTQKEYAHTKDQDNIEEGAIDTAPVEDGQEEQEENTTDVDANERNGKFIKKPIGAASFPNITINVDMSDWSDEKIRTFFKYAYGKFEED